MLFLLFAAPYLGTCELIEEVMIGEDKVCQAVINSLKVNVVLFPVNKIFWGRAG